MLRDPFLDNVAAILTNAADLERAGSLSTDLLDAWRDDQAHVYGDDFATQEQQLQCPRPLTHIIAAAHIFRTITGCVVDVATDSRSAGQNFVTHDKITHRNVYKLFFNSDKARAEQQFCDRVTSRKGWLPLSYVTT